MDVHTREQRSHNMRQIRARDTKPELIIRKALHKRGFRYRLHGPQLPGRPDLVFRQFKAVIFVHGCFWHGHDCPKFRLPATRSSFWDRKIVKNRARDELVAEMVAEQGWRSLVIWECAIAGTARIPLDNLTDLTAAFLYGSAATQSVVGNWPSGIVS